MRSSVTIVDGRNAVSDYYERKVGEVLTVVDSYLFVLGPGRRFNRDARRPLGIGDAVERPVQRRLGIAGGPKSLRDTIWPRWSHPMPQACVGFVCKGPKRWERDDVHGDTLEARPIKT